MRKLAWLVMKGLNV